MMYTQFFKAVNEQIFLCIYLKSIRERERQKTFHLLVYCLNGYSRQSWARPQPRARTTFRSLTWVERAQVYLDYHLLPSQAHQQGNQIRSRTARTSTSTPKWHSAIPQRGLAHCTSTPGPTSSNFISPTLLQANSGLPPVSLTNNTATDSREMSPWDSELMWQLWDACKG